MWVAKVVISNYGAYGKVAIKVHNEVVFMIIDNETIAKSQTT